VRWSPINANHLASCSNDNTIKLWDIRQNNKALRSFDSGSTMVHQRGERTQSTLVKESGAHALYWLDSGTDLMVATRRDRQLSKHSVYSEKTLLEKSPSLPFMGGGGHLAGDGRHLMFVPNGKRIDVYNTRNLAHLQTIPAHFQRVNALCFQRATDKLFTAGDEGVLFTFEQQKISPMLSLVNDQQDYWSD